MKQMQSQTTDKNKINSNDIQDTADSIELKIVEIAPEATMEDVTKVVITNLAIFHLFIQQQEARELFKSFLKRNHLTKAILEL